MDKVKGTISRICDVINSAFKGIRPAAKKIPSILTVCSGLKRPGLSPKASFGNVMVELSKNGINVTRNSDGSYDELGIIIYTIFKEVYRAMKEDANVQGGTMPNSMTMIGTGTNAGGPIVINGTNISCGEIASIIQ